MKTPDNKWALTPSGQPRNPLSFTPFFGGKRICLGKTFAEVVTKFTVPLLMHHLDFEFVDRETQSANKQMYSIGGQKEIDMPMKVSIRNKVKI